MSLERVLGSPVLFPINHGLCSQRVCDFVGSDKMYAWLSRSNLHVMHRLQGEEWHGQQAGERWDLQ